MSPLGEILTELFNDGKRRHLRYRMSDKVRIEIGAESPQKFQIEDISLGGLAFLYEEGGADYDTDNLRLLPEPGEPFPSIWFKQVSDLEMAPAYQGGPNRRRKGVQFENLTREQKRELKEFIEQHAVERL